MLRNNISTRNTLFFVLELNKKIRWQRTTISPHRFLGGVVKCAGGVSQKPSGAPPLRPSATAWMHLVLSHIPPHLGHVLCIAATIPTYSVLECSVRPFSLRPSRIPWKSAKVAAVANIALLLILVSWLQADLVYPNSLLGLPITCVRIVEHADCWIIINIKW